MKIRVDNEACQGHARCFAVAEDLFPLDDIGYSAIRDEVEVPDGREADARAGALACPERAITIVE